MTPYKAIFEGIENTLASYLGEDVTWLRGKFKDVSDNLSDAEYYKRLVTAIFAAGTSIEVYQSKHDALMGAFPDAHTVVAYTPSEIVDLKQDEAIIRQQDKIDACVSNAKWFVERIEVHGTFKNYIESFSPHRDEEALEKLRATIDELAWLGPVNSRHYLTMIGLPMIKPDRVICRILYRLGFTPSAHYNDPATVKAAIETAKAFVEATGHSMRYVDLVLVNFGRATLNSLAETQKTIPGICVEAAPQCEICEVRSFCQFYQQSIEQMDITVSWLFELAKQLTHEERAELAAKLSDV